jgi:sporulation protein YlmC with PRC-barrel domain
MKDAPTFKSDGWNTIGDTKWGEIVHEFYSIEKNPDYDRERPDFVPAGAVIGARVENRRGDNLGAVKDIVIDSDKNDVAYTVLQFGNDKLFAAPWESLNVSDGGKKIVIRGVEREDLEKAAGFANNRWPNYRDLGWEGDVNFDSRPPNWVDGFRESGGNRPDRPDRPNNNNDNNNNDNDDDADRGAMGGWQTHGKYGQLFDRNKIERVRGKVVRSESVTPLSGMDPGIALTVRDENDKNVVVHVGPEWFVRHQQDKFTEGEDVDVSGSRVNVDGKPVIMATQLRVRGRTLTLRNDNGVPAWDAWQERK